MRSVEWSWWIYLYLFFWCPLSFSKNGASVLSSCVGWRRPKEMRDVLSCVYYKMTVTSVTKCVCSWHVQYYYIPLSTMKKTLWITFFLVIFLARRAATECSGAAMNFVSPNHARMHSLRVVSCNNVYWIIVFFCFFHIPRYLYISRLLAWISVIVIYLFSLLRRLRCVSLSVCVWYTRTASSIAMALRLLFSLSKNRWISWETISNRDVV